MKVFYHIKNLQGTKTSCLIDPGCSKFYHIKNLQGTKTSNNPINLRSEKTTKNHGNKNNLQGFTTVGIFSFLKHPFGCDFDRCSEAPSCFDRSCKLLM